MHRRHPYTHRACAWASFRFWDPDFPLCFCAALAVLVMALRPVTAASHICAREQLLVSSRDKINYFLHLRRQVLFATSVFMRHVCGGYIKRIESDVFPEQVLRQLQFTKADK